MKRRELKAPSGRHDPGRTARRQFRESRLLDHRGTPPSLGDGGSPADPRETGITPTDGISPPNGAGNGARHANGNGANKDAPNAGGSSGDEVATRSPEAAFHWTATGISLSLDGLTVDADHATSNQYGQRALVSVRWRDRLCYRQRMNLDDPHQRQTFIEKLKLSCRQAGMNDETEPLSIIANRVTPAMLIRLGEDCGRRPEKPPTDTREEKLQRRAAKHRARKLLHDRAILSRVAEAMRANGYAGKLEPAVLAYVALTSRLLERPISLAFVADPAAGKNATIDAALELVPREEAVYEFTASSPTALVYSDKQFQHRVVIFKEADSIPDRGPAASAIRALADDNVLRYEVTIRGPRTGSFETWRIEKAGPTGLITTSTRTLSPQLHTRLLPVPIVDDVQTTFQVIRAKGEQAAGRLRPPDLKPFLALQRWLAIASERERRVTVPFGWALAHAMSGCSLELRTRRDFEGLLGCVKTIAFLRQCHRKRAPGGAIEAIIDDYRVARQLLVGSFSRAAAESLTAAIRETVNAIPPDKAMTRTELGVCLGGRPKQTVSYRVTKALERELLSEEKRGGKRLLSRYHPLPEELPPLPDVEEVAGIFFGVPAPRRSPCFDKFIHDFQEAGQQGVTAAEWAARVGQPLEVVRERLDALVRAQPLGYDEKTERYAVRLVTEYLGSE